MITYRASGKRFGSIEQAVREAEALLEALRDPAHSSHLFDEFGADKVLAGVADCPPMDRVHVVVDLYGGCLRVRALEETEELEAIRLEDERNGQENR